MDIEKVKEILDFIENNFVDTVEPDQTIMHHIDDAEWKSVKARAYTAIHQLDTEPCPECGGKGRTELLGRCWTCEGTGRVPKSETPVKVRRLNAQDRIEIGSKAFEKGKKLVINKVMSKGNPVAYEKSEPSAWIVTAEMLMSCLIRQLNPDKVIEEVE